MTKNEQKLISMIRENDNPARAMSTAVFIVLGYLTQHGSSQAPTPADQQGLA